MTDELTPSRISKAANTQRRAGLRFRLTGVMLVLLMLITTVGGYLYINRDLEPAVLKIGAGPFRTDSYQLMQEVADVVSRNSDILRIEVVSSRDSSSNISLLNQGKIDLATIRSDTPVVNNVRMVADLFPDFFQIISRADAPIFQPTDLVGKRIAIADFGTDEFRSFWIIGDHYDLPIQSINWKTMNFQRATDRLLAGQVDAIFTVRSLRDRLLLNLFEDAELKNLNLRFVSIDQAEAISIKRPFLDTGIVPKGAFLGKQPTPLDDATTVTVDRVLVTRDDLPEEHIRELTRILFENRLDLTIRFALANAINRPMIDEGLNIPLHSGSQQFYTRDEPTFLQENAEPLTLVVTLLAMLASSLFALRSRFISTQKDRLDSYNYELLDIAELGRNTDDIAELKELKQDMYSMLERVVLALDKDALTEEGFQSFSLLWETVREILNERITEVQSEEHPVDLIEPKLKSHKKRTSKARKEHSSAA